MSAATAMTIPDVSTWYHSRSSRKRELRSSVSRRFMRNRAAPVDPSSPEPLTRDEPAAAVPVAVPLPDDAVGAQIRLKELEVQLAQETTRQMELEVELVRMSARAVAV